MTAQTPDLADTTTVAGTPVAATDTTATAKQPPAGAVIAAPRRAVGGHRPHPARVCTARDQGCSA